MFKLGLRTQVNYQLLITLYLGKIINIEVPMSNRNYYALITTNFQIAADGS